ncbi:Glu/Leu/Phe/Val dehydrogenase dimerization domain-containing protein [uncultured Maritalea sp.]|uniref:Leu/Phe/Val dehydrogenase n=1 Tax=uncultured Maritalea sp. TaxID=757249 RepID=UPI0026135021|nr:Glu/Leu/Phe/Val dehydrogenase dimerization domain-containing protein [uncultured Maritalea sp.]
MKLKELDAPGYERVVLASDDATGLRSIIAIHSTKLGPAAGGCRMFNYENIDAAETDALRLAKGMTYKNAAASLPLGGGKSVIIADPRKDKTPELMQTFGKFVNELAGTYYTAEDVGISVEDIAEAAKFTSYAAGLSDGPFGSGDPSPVTARGVFLCMQVAAKYGLGTNDLKGKTVAVQGLGHVGMHLCAHLHEAGAKLVATDINATAIEEASSRFGARIVDPDAIYGVEADIFAPCAMGASISPGSIPQLEAKVVAGAANNQLADENCGQLLADRGILYAPDYVVNGGGIINVAAEILKISEQAWVEEKVIRLADTTDQILSQATTTHALPHIVADQWVDNILAKA